MGSIIGLDTSIFIYLFEDHPTYRLKAQRLLNKVASGKSEAVFSVIGMIELQTGPKKLGRPDLAVVYQELLTTFPHLEIIGLNEEIVDLTSDLRVKYGIATPDAIHLATAIQSGAKRFVTNDKRLQKVKEIKVTLL